MTKETKVAEQALPVAPQKALSTYEKMAAINVNEHIEKKNNLSYLSWAWAVDQLLRQDPTASWAYHEPIRWNDTVMVFCTVTAFGKPMTSQLPVMDHKNKAISNPDAFAVNTAMQRCLAKAIALHGLGLYIYAGEDLPLAESEAQEEVKIAEQQKAITEEQAKELERLVKAHGRDLAAVLGFYKVDKFSDLAASRYDRVHEALSKPRQQEAKA